MEKENRARYLRAARAFLGLDQAVAARGAGIGWNTLIDAEKGRACTGKTWAKMVSYYRGLGLAIVEDEELNPVAIRPA